MAANNNHFGLRLDTEGPVLSNPVYSPAQGSGGHDNYYGSDVNSVSVTVSVADRADVTAKYYRYLVSASAEVTDSQLPATWTAVSGNTITVAATYHSTRIDANTVVDACANYIHIQALDDVGNKSAIFTSKLIVIDHVNPVIYSEGGDTSIDHTTVLTKDLEGHKLYISAGYSDNYPEAWAYKTPFKHVHFEADVGDRPHFFPQTGQEDYEFADNKIAINYTEDITLGTPDGWKYATITVTNYAGNRAEYRLNQKDNSAIELDQTGADININIVDGTTHELVGSPTNTTALAGKVEVIGGGEKHDVVQVSLQVDGGDPITKSVSPTENPIFVPVTITEGTHTVTITATDSAGNTTTKVISDYIVDTSAPVVTCVLGDPVYSGDHYWFNGTSSVSATVTTNSAISGFDRGAVMIETPAGIDDITVTMLTEDVNDETYSYSCATLPENVDLNYEITAIDKATNTGVGRTHSFRVDRTAPEVGIVRPVKVDFDNWFNSTFDLSIAYTENGSGMKEMYVWVSTASADTTVPAGTTKIETFAGSPLTVAKGAINWTGLEQSATNYLHIKAVDNVGNVSYLHQVFKYDNQITDPTISTSTYVVASATAGKVSISFSTTDVSGITHYRLQGGDIVETDWIPLTTSEIAAGKVENIGVTLKSPDGEKWVYAEVKDAAGNTSTEAPSGASCMIELDTVHPVPETTLLEPGSTTVAKKNPSSIKDVTLKLYESNDASETVIEYKVWGDYEGLAADEASATWVRFTEDQLSQLHSTGVFINYTCTDNSSTEPERKEISVKFRDNSEVESAVVTKDFTYDPVVAEITVSDIDYQVISKVATPRLESDGSAKAGTLCDTMTFKFSANKKIVAWKVCAYKDQAAAEEGTALNTVNIPMTAGSVNMNGSTPVAATEKVSCTIKGADYESALKAKVGADLGKNIDGIHYVVVFGQNESGDWSSKAIFA